MLYFWNTASVKGHIMFASRTVGVPCHILIPLTTSTLLLTDLHFSHGYDGCLLFCVFVIALLNDRNLWSAIYIAHFNHALMAQNHVIQP